MSDGPCLAATRQYALPELVQMFDAFGKIPSGLLAGNKFALGDYDSCLRVPRARYVELKVHYGNVSMAGHDVQVDVATGGCVAAACDTPDLVLAGIKEMVMMIANRTAAAAAGGGGGHLLAAAVPVHLLDEAFLPAGTMGRGTSIRSRCTTRARAHGSSCPTCSRLDEGWGSS